MEHIERFIQILSRQLHLNKRLLELANEKREVLLGDDVKRLSEMIIDEQEMVKEMILLEKERASEAARIGRGAGIRKVEDIKEIVGRKSVEKMHEIEGLANELRRVLEELEEKNSTNQALMQFTLEYIDLNVNIMTAKREPSGYSKDKTLPLPGGGVSFDSKY
ncbi:FlgN protein [Peptoclostridium litorale DSM 5388]|uniref:FlgN family protein n=1 Tax=Peptoclostridium litorale DSM 5388 TaxID=1121324 RepID=A0A069REX9_PEPLI|nr:flagellar protein FlgN [Peptoclostridium litorale]KDR94755.1 hypothetical protein CLIT_13c00770 [Peptoclostridium litorale DSM 5388]SIN91975.1 FlgN protein [Peptoclostridium litorale DSM 5388]